MEGWRRGRALTKETGSYAELRGTGRLASRSSLFLGLLMRTASVTFRASPKTEASLFRPDLGKIHEVPIIGATDFRLNFHLENFWILGVEEIPGRGVVADETAGLAASIQRWLPGPAGFWNHLPVMLVAKHMKVSWRTGTPFLP